MFGVEIVNEGVLCHNTLEASCRFGNTDAGVILTNVNAYNISDNEMYFTDGGRNASAIVVAGGCDIGQIHHLSGVLNGAASTCMQFLSGSKNIMVDHV